MTWAKFRQQISNSFNIDEIQTLCFDLQIEYETIPGNNKDAKIRELIALLRRQNRLPELVAALERVRPHENWADILQASETPAALDRRNQTIWIVAAVAIFVAIVGIGLVALFNNQSPKEEVSEAVTDVATNTAVIPTATDTNTPTKIPSLVATKAPAPSPTNPVPPLVESVDEGKYMVLVAQLEPLTSNEHDITRFIVDDLQQTLVANIPYSEIQIREYPEIISSQQEARDVAARVGAPIIIWGNYDDEVAEVNISVGNTDDFPPMGFEQSYLEQTANARALLSNLREESVARYVVGLLLFLQSSLGESVTATSVLAADIAVNSARLDGDNVATRLHTFGDYFYKGELENAKIELDAAYQFDAGSPIIYFYRSVFNAQLGLLDAARDDAETAMRIGPDNWGAVHEVAGYLALFENDIIYALEQFQKFEESRPDDDWRPHYAQGVAYLTNGDFAQARVHFEQAIALEPDVNWPYLFALNIALRDGRLLDAVALSQTIVNKFPDPTFGNRVLETSIGADFLGPLLSGMGNMLIGQFEEANNDLDKALQQIGPSADLYWLKGFTECRLGNLELAEEMYSTAIELDPSFILSYLSRASIRLRLENPEGAEADFQAIQNSELATSFTLVIPYVQTRQLTCDNFLDFNPLAPPPLEENTPTPLPETKNTATVNSPITIFAEANASSQPLLNLGVGEIVEVNGRSSNPSWLYVVFTEGEESIMGFVSARRVDYDGDVSELPVQD